MSEQNNKHGKREAEKSPCVPAQYWSRYKAWLAGLDRGQRIRYRVLQAATVIALVIIIVFLALRAWVQVPDLEDLNQGLNGELTGNFSVSGAEGPDVPLAGRREGVYTFLLVGKDVASGSTDTMLLLTYDTNEKTIHGLNLPRDTMVNVSTTSKRLNAVYSYNRGKDKATQVEKGMAALKEEVSHLTGIIPDFYVLVEWEAIGKLVDALGGVEFEVPFNMDYDDPAQDLHIHQKAGLRVLDGEDAMEVIRFRKSNDGSIQLGDVGRLTVQQDFLKAVAKKCLQPAIFLKINELAKIFTDNVTTDLSLGNILAFAELAFGMDPEEGVAFATAPIGASFNYRGAALVTLDETQLLTILNDSMNPYYKDIEAGDLQLVYRKNDGTFGVTNAELADPQMGKVQVTQSQPSSQPAQDPVEAETPVDSEQPGGEPQNGDTSQPDAEEVPDSSAETEPSGDGEDGQPREAEEEGPEQSEVTAQSGEPAQDEVPIGAIDPDQVLPDPSANVSEDVSAAQTEEGDTVAVLPSRPEPVGQAA